MISNKLEKFGIKKRTRSQVNQKYTRKDFSDEPIEKAYLIGFRLGDLHVRRTSTESLGIGSSTTKKEQLELMQSLFQNYVHTANSESKGVYSFSCQVNNSFTFLEPKEDCVPNWILQRKESFYSFLAGYTDAEGNIGIYNKRARFRLGSYDKNILTQITNELNKDQILAKLRLETPKGYKNGNTINNGDLWRISISYKTSLIKLFTKIKPLIKHEKRKRDLEKAEANVIARMCRR